jgi:phosphoenolpyruvate-protein kinase (PTS system EI component)
MASDPAQLPVLLGLGLREFSVQPRAIVPLRAAIRATDAASARIEAMAALEHQDLTGTQDVRE